MQTGDELKLATQAKQNLEDLTEKWTAVFREYRRLQSQNPAKTAEARQAHENKLQELQQMMTQLNEQMARAQRTLQMFGSQQQHHGYVWLFLRKPLKN